MSLSYKEVKSPVGKLKLVADDKGLVAILWENDKVLGATKFLPTQLTKHE
jgi:hypothetical protein